MTSHISYASNYQFFKILTAIKKIDNLKSRLKPLTCHLKNKGGRSHGSIITPRRGNYYKRTYRHVDFKRLIFPENRGLVLCNMYDPNRSANITLICYPIGYILYILQPSKLKIGDTISNNTVLPRVFGDSASLNNIPSGRLIHNIQGKFTRSAGCSTILVRKDIDQILVKLKSGELRYFHTSVLASLGVIGNENHFLRNYRYAGLIRILGRRPRSRPLAMNPVDHPMGGRTKGGQAKNRAGILTKGHKTVKFKNPMILYTKRQLKLLRL